METPARSRPKKRYLLCSSSRDADGKTALVAHLAAARASLSVWTTDEVPPGGLAALEFRRNAAEADGALLLISASFFAELDEEPLRSQIELLRQQHKSGTLQLIPLIWRDCDWGATSWIAALKPWPEDGAALCGRDLAQRDRTLADIVRRLDGRSPQTQAGFSRWTLLGRRWGALAVACLAAALGGVRTLSTKRPGASPTSQPPMERAAKPKSAAVQTVWKVEGLVRDRRHKPVPGVTVSMPALATTTLTDEQGYFRLAVQTEREGLVLLRAQPRAATPGGPSRYRPHEIHVSLGSTGLDLVLEDNR